MDTINTSCFKSIFNYLLIRISFDLACWYISFHDNKSEFHKELYATKRTIIKVTKRRRLVTEYFFSVHRKVPDPIHQGRYKWYYEKYQILYDKEKDDIFGRYQIVRYGHYPYTWE